MFIECVYFCLGCGCLSLKEWSNCSSWFIQAKVRGAELKARDCNGIIILWQWIFVYCTIFWRRLLSTFNFQPQLIRILIYHLSEVKKITIKISSCFKVSGDFCHF